MEDREERDALEELQHARRDLRTARKVRDDLPPDARDRRLAAALVERLERRLRVARAASPPRPRLPVRSAPPDAA